MPTIDVHLGDFEALLGRRVDEESLGALLAQVKGEIKVFDRPGDQIKIELNDSNRPDLWSAAGIARQIRGPAARPVPAFFSEPAHRQVIVSPGLAVVRPYLAACAAHGLRVTAPMLAQMIQSQEKLAEIFGQKRHSVSIGLYRLHQVVFPVRYTLACPETTRFVPLGLEAPMSLAQILKDHPKGRAYADTLRGAERYPLLIDAKDHILSFPPIINSRALGEVQVGDDALLVEVTGTNLRMVILALNILACDLADRKATIEPIEIVYPEATDFGQIVKTPLDFSAPMSLDAETFGLRLGEEITVDEAARWLSRYGYRASHDQTTVTATAPPYRDDLMHAVDVVEDFAISRGYATFAPQMPSTFTVGGLDPMEQLSDRLRAGLVGLGFQEGVSNILTARQEMVDRMNLDDAARPERRIVEIANPMSDRFCVLRSWILPALLRVEAASSKAFYPHRIFEVGEVVHRSEDGDETTLHLAAALAHPKANFSEMQSVLEHLIGRMGYATRLAPIGHPTFIAGRIGAILLQSDASEPRSTGEIEAGPDATPAIGAAPAIGATPTIGWIGEVHPEVLTRWQIGMPVAAFEITLEPFLSPV